MPATASLHLNICPDSAFHDISDLLRGFGTSDCGWRDGDVEVIGLDVFNLVEGIAGEGNAGGIGGEDRVQTCLERAAIAVTHTEGCFQKSVVYDLFDCQNLPRIANERQQRRHEIKDSVIKRI